MRAIKFTLDIENLREPINLVIDIDKHVDIKRVKRILKVVFLNQRGYNWSDSMPLSVEETPYGKYRGVLSEDDIDYLSSILPDGVLNIDGAEFYRFLFKQKL